MKAVVGAVVGVVIALGVFGVYRWAGHEDGERASAESAVNTYCLVIAPCRGGAAERSTPLAATERGQGHCVTSELEALHRGTGWRFRITCGRRSHCEAIDLGEFHVSRRDSVYVGTTAEGVEAVPCSPADWTVRQAAQHLERSSWARQRSARFFSCTGVKLPPGLRQWEIWAQQTPYLSRFGCSYSTPRGAGYVVLHTTGPDTFQVERES